MIKNSIKKNINNFLSLFNLRLTSSSNVNHLDLSNQNINPLTAQYMFGQKQMILNLDLSIGRTNRWFKMSSKSLDPSIFAISSALKKGLKSKNLAEEILITLKDEQSLTSLENMAELLNLKNDNYQNFTKYPWWATVYPWDNHTIDYKMKHFPYEVKKNRNHNGMNISSNDPFLIMKENSKNSLLSHSNQYAKLTDQIKKNGFKYGDEYNYVTAEILIKDNKFVWKPGIDGNHRVSVVSALDFKSIPVLVTKIIRLDEIEYWPNVKNGLFKKDEATKVFYSIFDAKPSKIYDNWIKKVIKI